MTCSMAGEGGEPPPGQPCPLPTPPAVTGHQLRAQHPPCTAARFGQRALGLAPPQPAPPREHQGFAAPPARGAEMSVCVWWLADSPQGDEMVPGRPGCPDGIPTGGHCCLSLVRAPAGRRRLRGRMGACLRHAAVGRLRAVRLGGEGARGEGGSTGVFLRPARGTGRARAPRSRTWRVFGGGGVCVWGPRIGRAHLPLQLLVLGFACRQRLGQRQVLLLLRAVGAAEQRGPRAPPGGPHQAACPRTRRAHR